MVAVILCAVGLVGVAVVVVPAVIIAVSHVHSEVILQAEPEVLATADAHPIGVAVLVFVTPGVVPLAVMLASMFSVVGFIMAGCIEVEELVVGVGDEDTQLPLLPGAEDWAVEVVGSHEFPVLVIGEHITGIFVAPVEQLVVIMDSISVTAHDIVHHQVGLSQEIIVNLVEVIVLLRRKVQFVGHSIGQETCAGSDF